MATGIVRRIDDLGQVVIPKEIRRTMRIREGDPPHIPLTFFGRFCGCTALTSIALPDSVTIIDEGAFMACVNLESIIIPATVTKIKRFAFMDCKAIHASANSYAYRYAKKNKFTYIKI